MSGISLKNNHENDGIGELNRGTPMIRRRTKFKIRIGVIAILIGLTGAWIKPAVAARIITKEHGRRWSNSCQSETECPPHAICDFPNPSSPFGICMCRSGYVAVAENDTKECHPIAQKLGDQCSYDIQCHERFSTESECWQGRCNCKLGSHHVPRSNVCYKSVRIGDFCRLTNNCIGEGTLCQRGLCTCPFATHPNEDFTECVPDRKLFEECSSDIECIVEASRCDDDRVCRCAADYVISESHSSCLKVADRLYGNCQENGQCTNVRNTFCDTQSDRQGGFCQCRPGFHNVNTTCFVTVDLGGICERNENCEKSAGAICKNSRCVCDDDYPGDCLDAIRSKGQQRVVYSKTLVLSESLILLLTYYLFSLSSS